jgi:3-oxoacyl-[acyl-carrier protein] reductase
MYRRTAVTVARRPDSSSRAGLLTHTLGVMAPGFTVNLELVGKRALVCGGSAGIGLACAQALAAHGAHVTLVSRDLTRLAEAVATLPTDLGQRHGYMAADLGVYEGLEERVRQLSETEGAFHIVVHNTGGPPSGSMLDASPEQLYAGFTSLLVAAHCVTRALVPGMKAAGYGRVIMISSTSVKQPIPNLGLSNALRAAVSNWGKSLSQELGQYGITVNSVLPGFVDTQRLGAILTAKAAKTGKTLEAVRAEAIAEIPAGRIGLPAEIAALVTFLAAPAGAYVNGTQIPVDGGRLKCL